MIFADDETFDVPLFNGRFAIVWLRHAGQRQSGCGPTTNERASRSSHQHLVPVDAPQRTDRRAQDDGFISGSACASPSPTSVSP